MSLKPIRLLFSLLLIATLDASGAFAARPLVSSNPHATNLPAGAIPPLKDIADIPCTAANAYHVSSGTEVTRALAYLSYGKPKILSDDASGITPAQAKNWIQRACNGGEHYEHFDEALSIAAQSAVTIDSLNDFPAASQDVLNYIKNQSCASDLTGGGVLSQSGSEFYWNRDTQSQPIKLVGHSWMGAVAGQNFNPIQYLNILASHRVNLTRIWVIEQWTGLAVRGPNPPNYSNSILPFNGQLSNGTVDLTSFNVAYLTRIKDFVQKASARGIVVQVTLFDRHGLRNNAGNLGQYDGSPYNPANSDPLWRVDLFGEGPAGKAPQNFVDLCLPTYTQEGPRPSFTGICSPQTAHSLFIKALRNELKDEGNVIFEIMNEPLSEEWGEAKITTFHRWAAEITIREGAETPTFGCFN